MRPTPKDHLNLGSNVVEELLPHTRPLLLVDRILAFRDGDTPEMEGSKFISANEPIFEGHFRHLHLWPGIFTQEGLGQSCNLLFWIVMARRRWENQGGDPDDVLRALRNLELGFRLHPGFDPKRAQSLRDQLPQDRDAIGMSSSVELRFLKPVFGGCRLDYLVQLTHEFQSQARFEVLASVENEPVAQGVLTAHVALSFQTMVTRG